MEREWTRTEMFQNNIAAVYRCECGERLFTSKDLGRVIVHPHKGPGIGLLSQADDLVPTRHGLAERILSIDDLPV